MIRFGGSMQILGTIHLGIASVDRMALAQVLSEENGRLRQALLEAESPHWIGCRYCQYTGMVDHVNPHTGEVARDLCPRCSV